MHLRLVCCVLVLLLTSCRKESIELASSKIKIEWSNDDGFWKISNVFVNQNGKWKSFGNPSGEYTILYSGTKPDSVPIRMFTNTGVEFPEQIFKYQQQFWKAATLPVTMNTAGEAVHFFPVAAEQQDGEIQFTYEHDYFTMVSHWRIDPRFPTDILITQKVVIKKDGYYSSGGASIAEVSEDDLAWATVPGYFQGKSIQEDSVLAYAYGQGVPAFPALYRERSMSTLTAIVDTRDSISYAVTASADLGRDPWENDRITHDKWNVAFSHMNRKGMLSPTLYYPVLGEPTSYRKAGDTIAYEFRYSLLHGDWFKSLKHTINDVFNFKESLDLRTNEQSLIDRVDDIHKYLTNQKTSLWNIDTYEGLTIGAQSYLGGVVGSKGDAMKNADYGAMWMLGKVTEDPLINERILPYALNFKLVQQQTKPGFFHGAAIGQYFLRQRRMFVEEWGEFVEPISLTYYTLIDMGNILLFEPSHKVLRERLRLGADLLLKWQASDGSWAVAYDRHTEQPIFTDIKDLRPTFYGLLVAYRILKDEKYLDAARNGADWLVKNGVEQGHFIGVCGDARYAPDFATGQISQALLDLYDVTQDERYRAAAIQAAKLYTTSIYTHPIPTNKTKTINGTVRRDWQIAQAGLSFEHGGIMGSAQRHGPIQLASHAGLFVRMFALTRDSIFIDMARAAAIGRDAFVDSKTSVASYYWNAMNKGAGPYPHHAWWQVGWIMDYLVAEAELRSEGNIRFPRGFVTPKVGPHQTLGFESGKIYNEAVNLVLNKELVTMTNPNIETLLALSKDKKKMFIILLNDKNKVVTDTVTLNARSKSITDLTEQKKIQTDRFTISLLPYGVKVIVIELI